MPDEPKRGSEEVLYLEPNGGRAYSLGAMWSVFKADGEETGNRYSVSEWWLDPQQPGPGAHSHDNNEEIFYVLEGTMTFQAGDAFIDAPAGAFLRIPARVVHNFENRSDQRAGVLNVYIPGGFEQDMPSIVKWYEDRAPEQ